MKILLHIDTLSGGKNSAWFLTEKRRIVLMLK